VQLCSSHVGGFGNPGCHSSVGYSSDWFHTSAAGPRTNQRCWTSDRLAQCGLSHLEKCPLCDQEDENIDHLLVSCVFSRQFWYHVLRQVGHHSLTPQPTYLLFDDWWERGSMATSGLTRKGLNSLIILGAWTIWNHRNRCL
jgi:hypothetical protein